MNDRVDVDPLAEAFIFQHNHSLEEADCISPYVFLTSCLDGASTEARRLLAPLSVSITSTRMVIDLYNAGQNGMHGQEESSKAR